MREEGRGTFERRRKRSFERRRKSHVNMRHECMYEP